MSSFWKFCLVGVINTLVDVPTFIALHAAGMSVLVANIISTSLALTVSYILNHRFTFPAAHVNATRKVLYVTITLSGLWLLAPLAIKTLMNLDSHVHYSAPFVAIFGHAAIFASLLPKLGSIVVTLAWNYLWYTRVVFLPKRSALTIDAEETTL